jgi:DNA repair exonuclease SbcCD ATPase subunit|tara:strand:- start:240 stop:1127 length:888 start_codon:yes stop_codon:yes gene_type:complete
MAEQAQEMVTDATPEKKAFMAKRSTHEDRIKKDEEELQQLLKEQTGDEEQEENKDSIEEKEEPKNAEERTFKKRYGDLRRHSQEKEKEYQKRLKDLESQLDNATKKEMKLPKSDEDLEAWAKEYPDVAKIVETIAMKKAREQSEQLEKKIKQIDEMNISAAKERAEVELLKLHPDFDEIRDSDDFHEWAEQQPKWIQDALYENENDARAAGRAIDLYKADRNIGKKDTSKDDKSAAKAINTKSKKTEVDVTETSKKIRESDVQRMSADQYEKNADMIMEAIRSGNFLYDISGSAR